MLQLPFNVPFELFILDLKHLPYFEHLQPELLGGTVVFVAIALSTAYIYCYKKQKPKGCLDPNSFKEFKLEKKTQISSDVARFRFALPTSTSILGLPVGNHILARGKDAQGEEVIAPYTPISTDSDVGYFELVVKMYPKGKMSHHFREMKEGDYLPVKGPRGHFSYKPGQVRAYGMLAGGAGITPMIQITKAILENPKDTTKLYLIYANETVDDILLKEELDGFSNKFPDRFKVYYVLNQPPNPWNGGVGFISKEMIQAHCPAPAPDIQIITCGPLAMEKAMAAHLDALGYTPNMQIMYKSLK